MRRKTNDLVETRPTEKNSQACLDPNSDYCRRLAEELSRGVAGRVELGSACYKDKEELQSALESHANLQWRAASETGYTPSKWLLEQEMTARGRRADDTSDIYTFADRESLIGLCLSGGGIRSATFNLGVLQALAEAGLMEHVDYLSSVSGGGYIHEFLASWILRDEKGRNGVERKLIPQPEPGCSPRTPEPIRWLRRYASYLTPRRGLLTADTWTMVAIWLRNTSLNQIPIVAFLATVLLLLKLLVPSPINTPSLVSVSPGGERALFGIGLLIGLWSIASIWKLGRELHYQVSLANLEGDADPDQDPCAIPADDETSGHVTQAKQEAKSEALYRRLLSNSQVQLWIVAPWMTAAAWFTYWLKAEAVKQSAWHGWIVGGTCAGILIVAAVVVFAGGGLRSYRNLRESAQWWNLAFVSLAFAGAALLSAVVACILGHSFIAGCLHFANAISAKIGAVSGMHSIGISSLLIDPWRLQVVLLPPLLLGVPYIATELSLGLVGREYAEAQREWLARLRAWSMLYGLLWIGLTGIALLGPYSAYFVWFKGPTIRMSAIAAFVGSHLVAILAGASSKSDGKRGANGFLGFKPMDLLALAAAPVAIFTFLLALSFGVEWLVGFLNQSGYAAAAVAWCLSAAHLNRYWTPRIGWIEVLIICAVILGFLAWLFGRRVDINEFSMLSFYRNRLTRCYMGASLVSRRPNPFTGFDMRNRIEGVANERGSYIPPRVVDLLPDKFNLVEKQPGKYDGPFPIFCTTLNLTTGEDLGAQERKGASFAFTPLYSGYCVDWTDAGRHGKESVSLNGYVPTALYAYPGGGIHVDTAVAISGAAVNPNHGYSSNPLLAFWMTFFNVRLGWWISNPRHARTWRAEEPAPMCSTSGGNLRSKAPSSINRPTPTLALYYLVKELFGSVNDKSPYVNLSDGGHFDNMGLYELVRRRCKFIVVCDAEQDEDMSFAGLGNAISRCRSDFGAEIDLDLRPLQLQDCGVSKAHCVVGTIKYPPPHEIRGSVTAGRLSGNGHAPLVEDDDNRYTGIVLYIKSSLVGDEPADLLAHRLQHPEFPQDPTANQWFTETQFESYRRLGHHIAITAIRPALPPGCDQVGKSLTDVKELFASMYGIWYPPTPEMQRFFSDHVAQYQAILRELRERPELTGLAERLNQNESAVKPWSAPASPAESLRYSRQFANSMLCFMHTVYNNLQLAFPDNRTSPHAQWWLHLFRRWCKVSLLRETWGELAPVFSREFHLFAERELELPGTDVHLHSGGNGQPSLEEEPGPSLPSANLPVRLG